MSAPAAAHFLDTSALIALMKRGLVAEPGALVSLFALGELAVGVSRADNAQREQARVSRAIGAAGLVLPTLRTASLYGKIVAQLQRDGQMIPTNDVWIAALAIENDLPLFSTDTKHLPRVSGLTFRACATPGDILHSITQSTAEEELLVRGLKAEPTIEAVKAALRSGWEEAETEAGIPLDDAGIRLSHLAAMPGRAFYTVGTLDAPTVMCSACWDANSGPEAWKAAESFFFRATERFPALDLGGFESFDAPAAPWISCIPLFEAIRNAKDHSYLDRIAMFESATAWALMDMEREEASSAG